jgi:hypothetical protein
VGSRFPERGEIEAGGYLPPAFYTFDADGILWGGDGWNSEKSAREFSRPTQELGVQSSELVLRPSRTGSLLFALWFFNFLLCSLT